MSDVARASDVPLWTCDFLPLKEAGGPPLESLTVGAKFGWKCHGDLAVNWQSSQAPLIFFAKDEEAYTLQILKVVRQDPNDVQYEVTGYKPGSFAPQYLRVLQAKGSPDEKGFEVNGAKWQIQSVLPPSASQQQPPQPYPAYGPWTVAMPSWFWVVLGLVLLALIYALFRTVRRAVQRRKMLEELKRHHTALSPLHQFYRDARTLKRRLHTAQSPDDFKTISSDLDREFRLFVLRQFQVPALDWSDRAILEDLRRRHKQSYKLAAEPLKRTLRELVKLKNRPVIELKDIEQLHRMSLDAAERLQPGGQP